MNSAWSCLIQLQGHGATPVASTRSGRDTRRRSFKAAKFLSLGAIPLMVVSLIQRSYMTRPQELELYRQSQQEPGRTHRDVASKR